MPGWEMKLIEAEARRLLALAAGDDGLRADLRALAREILAATGGPRRPAGADPQESPPEVAGEALTQEASHPDGPQDAGPQEPEPLHELTLGRRRPIADESHPPERLATKSATDDDLSAIEARCRSKAGAARRAAARLRRTADGTAAQAENDTTDPEMVEWSDRLTDGFCWMSATADSPSPDPSPLDDVGGCFEALAEGLSLMAGGRRSPGAIERALPLIAEAQAMVRAAFQRLKMPDDPDQWAAYEWVRQTAARHRIYLRRYMRADDPADPSRWPDLLDRIAALAGERLRARRHEPRIEAVAGPEPTAEVKKAARLLSGRSVVLIGGERRPEAQDALKDALGLEHVHWVETKEHQPVASFEAAIARPEVALVLLAIRWSSHSFGEVRRFCERYGKPLVRLPAGYGPNQVAAQVLSQCGERLRGG